MHSLSKTQEFRVKIVLFRSKSHKLKSKIFKNVENIRIDKFSIFHKLIWSNVRNFKLRSEYQNSTCHVFGEGSSSPKQPLSGFFDIVNFKSPFDPQTFPGTRNVFKSGNLSVLWPTENMENRSSCKEITEWVTNFGIFLGGLWWKNNVDVFFQIERELEIFTVTRQIDWNCGNFSAYLRTNMMIGAENNHFSSYVFGKENKNNNFQKRFSNTVLNILTLICGISKFLPYIQDFGDILRSSKKCQKMQNIILVQKYFEKNVLISDACLPHHNIRP